jgi:hypothetical protein
MGGRGGEGSSGRSSSQGCAYSSIHGGAVIHGIPDSDHACQTYLSGFWIRTMPPAGLDLGFGLSDRRLSARMASAWVGP